MEEGRTERGITTLAVQSSLQHAIAVVGRSVLLAPASHAQIPNVGDSVSTSTGYAGWPANVARSALDDCWTEM